MDGARFDGLARAVACPVPRRTVLGGPLVAGLAALWARFGSEDAMAKKRRNRKRKRKKRRKRQNRCPALAVRCQGRCCNPGQGCEDPGSGCINGSFAVGDTCDPALAGQCASGNCGCDGDDCFCRIAQCSEFRCFLDIECCQGRCVNGTICAGG